MHPLDHLFTLLILIALPAYGTWSWHRWLAAIAAGRRPHRLRLYLGSMAQLWLLFFLLVGLWQWLSRPTADLGYTAPAGMRFWVGAALVSLGAAVFFRSWLAVRRAGVAERERYREQIGQLGHMMPRNRGEYALFVLLSCTAGIVEETLYRGYLLWYLGGMMPLAAAVVVSSLAFGLAHGYQGAAGIGKTAVVGLVLAVLYLYTGSLWLPIIAHAVVDILQGATMLSIYRDHDGAPGGGGTANLGR